MSFDCTDGTPVAVHSLTYHTARKTHVCHACGRPIRPGHRYAREFVVFESMTQTTKRCGACQLIHSHLVELCRKHNANPEAVLEHGERWPESDLGCGLNYADEWGAAPPDSIARLPMLSDDEAGALLGGGRG